MNFLRALSELEQIEKTMAELYAWCGGLFRGDPEAVDLFSHLRLEELSHQNILDYERRIALANPRRFREITVDSVVLEEKLQTVRRFMDAPSNPPLPEAVRAALEFEQSAAELYYKSMAAHASGELGRFIEHLHAGSTTHYERLSQFALGRGLPLRKPDAQQVPDGAPPRSAR